MPSHYNHKEHFTKKAKQQGYFARSVYKLQEIHRKHLSLRNCNRVLDLGAAPGSWTQYLQNHLPTDAHIVAVDIQPLRTIVKTKPKIHFIQGDFTSHEVLDHIQSLGLYDLIVSDAAPSTSGIKHLDQYRSEELVLQVIDIAKSLLTKQGQLVTKLFQGAGTNNIIQQLRKKFSFVTQCRPQAIRSQSVEEFIVCR